jgi:putative sugar O-methyltransferase
MTSGISALWTSLSQTLFAKIDDEFISTFRRASGANSRLGTWDPFDKTMRYFKVMLYATSVRQPDRFFELYRALGRVNIGQPVSVTVRSCEINIDYLFALEEFLFIESAIDLNAVKSVIEIGAGFGRTCHALLALAKDIDRYTIVDLPEVLELSRRVLAEVIPKHFHKVRFINAAETAEWQKVVADLAINIDSFQEMPPPTIDAYMNGMIANCRHFYVKNPVGKYNPKDIGIIVDESNKFSDVFSLGYCQNVIDIFDDAALSEARAAYVLAYRPAFSWRLIMDKPMDMFPYLHHALYKSA